MFNLQITMRLFLIFSFLLLMRVLAFAQQQNIDVLRQNYYAAKSDSIKQSACLDLIVYFNEVNRDSALFYIEQRHKIAKRIGYKLLEASVLSAKAYQKTQIGEYAEALKCIMQCLEITQDSGNHEINLWRISPFPSPGNERFVILSAAFHQMGLLMRETENLEKEIEYFKKALHLASEIKYVDRQMVSSMNVGSAYLRKGLLDSALYYGLKSDSIAQLPTFKGFFRGRNLANLGDVYFKMNDFQQAKSYYLKGLEWSVKLNNQFNVAVIKHKLIILLLREKKTDSALYYAKDNLTLIQLLKNGANFQLNLSNAYEDIYLAYQQKNMRDSAYKYLNLAFHFKDSLHKIRVANLSAFQNVSFDEAIRLKNIEKNRIEAEAKIRTYSLIAGLIIASFVGIILYRNNLQKKKSNLLLKEQKEEIELQKKQVEIAMEQLQSTQAQLVQSEKMASLGELTAGIAHEIQNPLNFVNNFSEVSNELIDEMQNELDKGDIDEAKAIASDIQHNLSKIAHHGKRADSIVKGMLQHSRSDTGKKELTDINTLCDEHLRLSYHGLRAKYSSFNAAFATEFDTTVGQLNIVPQEIGRVLLNLLNNAFYAVNQKSQKGIIDYTPKVFVKTKRTGERVKISIEDNGMGIPDSIREKIFQPFFTTKPTGEGTGLGLSLSYEIVTKGHGGKLWVESNAEGGSEFVILL